MSSTIKVTALFILTLFGVQLYGQSFDQLNAEIESYMKEELWKKAETSLFYALKSYDLDDQTKSNLNHNLGFCKLQIEDYLGAKYYLGQALELKLSVSNKKTLDYAKTAQLLGDLSLSIGDYNRALEYLEDADEVIVASVGASTDEHVESLLNLGQFYEAIGNYATSHQYFSDAQIISEEIHKQNSPEYANVINHIGRIYVKNGGLSQAEEYLLKANDIYRNLGPKYNLQYVESLENLAILYEHKGEFVKAEKLLLTIEKEKRLIPNLSEESLMETLNDLGILYLDLNNVARAKGYFEEVKKISQSELGKTHKYYATALNNLSAIYKQEGDFKTAKDLSIKALEIYEATFGKVHPQYSSALNNLASIERNLREYSSSETHYKEVLEIDSEIYGKQHPNYATALNNLGILYSSIGNNALAGQYYQQAINIRKVALGVNHPAYARSLENLGLHYLSLNDLVKAEGYFKEAIDIQIRQLTTVFPTITENERALFYKRIKEDVERYDFIAMKLLGSKPELIQNIINHQIATKGVLFTASERITNAIYNSQNNELIDQYTKWSEAKLKLAGYYQLGNQKLESYGIDIKSMELEIENMEKSMIQGSELFSGLFLQDQPSWQDLRRVLAADQALVEVIRFREFGNQMSQSSGQFGFTNKVYYMFIIVKKDSYTNPEFVIMENGVALEKKGFSLYANSVKYDVELKASYLNYWEPIDKKLVGMKNVTVSPDGVYFKMNPNVLRATDDRYVIDKYFVTYVTNSKELLKKIQPTTNQLTATLIGNPAYGQSDGTYNFSLANLLGAQKEVETISDLLKKNNWIVRTFTGSDASEARLHATYQPTVLHVATHGYFSDNDPIIARITPGNNPMFKSGLYLRGAVESYGKYRNNELQDSNNDGILSSYEIMNLNLNKTRLVILSACETALGDVEVGEGVYGLQRSILVAGAQNVITSMTKVDDIATQILMSYFYESFLKTNNVAQSFREAQQMLRVKYPDPKIWGAFLLTGNG